MSNIYLVLVLLSDSLSSCLSPNFRRISVTFGIEGLIIKIYFRAQFHLT